MQGGKKIDGLCDKKRTDLIDNHENSGTGKNYDLKGRRNTERSHPSKYYRRNSEKWSSDNRFGSLKQSSDHESSDNDSSESSQREATSENILVNNETAYTKSFLESKERIKKDIKTTDSKILRDYYQNRIHKMEEKSKRIVAASRNCRMQFINYSECFACGNNKDIKICQKCKFVYMCQSKCKDKSIYELHNRYCYDYLDLPGIAGIENQGYNCYASSALQLLLRCDQIRNYFVYGYFLRYAISREGYDVVMEFAKCLKKMSKSSDKVINIEKFLKLFRSKSFQLFDENEQHDAEEFLASLLDILHQYLNTANNTGKSPDERQIAVVNHELVNISVQQYFSMLRKTHRSIINDTIHGLYRSQLLCFDCGYSKITYEPFSILSLTLPEESTSHHERMKIIYFRLPIGSVPIATYLGVSSKIMWTTLYDIIGRQTQVSPSNLIIVVAKWSRNNDGTLKYEIIPYMSKEIVCTADYLLVYETDLTPYYRHQNLIKNLYCKEGNVSKWQQPDPKKKNIVDGYTIIMEVSFKPVSDKVYLPWFIRIPSTASVDDVAHYIEGMLCKPLSYSATHMAPESIAGLNDQSISSREWIDEVEAEFCWILRFLKLCELAENLNHHCFHSPVSLNKDMEEGNGDITSENKGCDIQSSLSSFKSADSLTSINSRLMISPREQHLLSLTTHLWKYLVIRVAPFSHICYSYEISLKKNTKSFIGEVPYGHRVDLDTRNYWNLSLSSIKLDGTVPSLKLEIGCIDDEDKMHSKIFSKCTGVLILTGRDISAENIIYFNMSPPNLRKDIPLENLLLRNSQEDILCGDEAWCCEKCNVKGSSLKSLDVCYTSDVLIIRLSRFSFDLTKNAVGVEFPVSNFVPLVSGKKLCVEDFIGNTGMIKWWDKFSQLEHSSENNETKKYELVGVVTHLGRNIESGHYVTYGKIDTLDCWYCFDDDIMRKVSKENLQHDKRNTYLLAYRQIKE